MRRRAAQCKRDEMPTESDHAIGAGPGRRAARVPRSFANRTGRRGERNAVQPERIGGLIGNACLGERVDRRGAIFPYKN